MSQCARRGLSMLLVACLVGLVTTGCKASRQARRECPTPSTLGMNTRDMVDKAAQDEYDLLANVKAIPVAAEISRKQAFDKAMKDRNPNAPPFQPKSVLCLSGGGSFGAFTAGVLCGWTCCGNRPDFDVVTGISTGSLIAPYAFLGPAYDAQMKRFYTTLESRDLYKMKPVRGLAGEALADNSPLANQVKMAMTPEVVAEIACEHMKGRRLYVGTTAAESKQFVVWDIGAIACKGRPQDRDLIIQVLLGSSAIPGVFPPQHITVDVDGICVTERHIDGGVSQAIFMHPPYVPPEYRSQTPNTDLAGTNLGSSEKHVLGQVD